MFRYLMILPKVSRPFSTPASSTRRSFSSRIMSEDSLAISAALSTEIPTSASRSAGASLMPSPRKPTVWPFCWNSRTSRAFCGGVSLANRLLRSAACASSMSLIASISSPVSMPLASSPTSRQMRAVIVGLSPVSTFTATPLARSALIASPALAFGGSRKVSIPSSVSSRSSACVSGSAISPARVATSSTRKPCWL